MCNLYYLCSENKDADQLCGYRIVFVYAKIWFSHDAAHLVIGYGSFNGNTLLDPPWSENGSPLRKCSCFFDFIVPHEAHDKFVLGLTLF